MKKILFLLFIPFLLFSNDNFAPFVKEQLKIIKKMNSDDLNQTMMLDLVKLQEQMYKKHINYILSNKVQYLDETKVYKSDIFALRKIIKLNERLGKTYGVLRDEVLIKTYTILDMQTKMIQKLLKSLDDYDFNEYQKYTSDLFAQNQIDISKINNKDYIAQLELNLDTKTYNQAKENIKDFYAVIDMNHDIIKYFSFYDKKMYSLNEYAKYGLLGPVMKINNSELTQSINKFLAVVELSIVKIIFMLLVSVFIYIISKYVFQLFKNLIIKIKYIEKYSFDILKSINKPVKLTLILINIELVIYTYNDFVSYETTDMVFSIGYSILFTLVVYKILNSIAKIKISNMATSSKNIKNEVINISVKIINFLILIFGLLLVLHSAGVNLTAVLSGLGIGGLALALAAKDSLANFFGTLSILLSDTFSQGDWIVADGQEGTVVEIGLRVTTIRTFDNALISIPNANLANADIKNWNKRRLGRRIKMSLGVKYDSKAEDIKSAVVEIREMLLKHPKIASDETKINVNNSNEAKIISREDSHGIKKTLLVYLDEFNDSSINILVYCFSKTVIWSEWLEVKEDVMFKMMEIFERNNLEFAYPSISIYKEE
ncbi:MAG: mechanosensitive ion channel family protein [Sulfurimonas sp.]|nr:mechanosensitive ion channel family protein [Sulfurimonas sp.]